MSKSEIIPPSTATTDQDRIEQMVDERHTSDENSRGIRYIREAHKARAGRGLDGNRVVPLSRLDQLHREK